METGSRELRGACRASYTYQDKRNYSFPVFDREVVNVRHRDQSARQDQVTLHVSSPTFHFYQGLDLSFMSSPYSVAMH